MQGVQQQERYLRSAAARLAAYEGYCILGRCPECRSSLTSNGEDEEQVCSRCGIVVGRASTIAGYGSSTSAETKNEPLGSFIADPRKGGDPSLRGPEWGWKRLMPNITGREWSLLACSKLTKRISERLMLPNTVVDHADMTARRLLPGKKAYGTTVPAISAYSLLYACRSAGLAHISHREILRAYKEAGYRVGRSQLIQLGLESSMPLPQVTLGGLVGAAVSRLQANETVAARLRKTNLDPKAYFTRLFELAKEVATESSELRGFNPRTVATGSVYMASVVLSSSRVLTQWEAGQTLRMAEYSVRDFCCQTRRKMTTEARLAVKSGLDLGRT